MHYRPRGSPLARSNVRCLAVSMDDSVRLTFEPHSQRAGSAGRSREMNFTAATGVDDRIGAAGTIQCDRFDVRPCCNDLSECEGEALGSGDPIGIG